MVIIMNELMNHLESLICIEVNYLNESSIAMMSMHYNVRRRYLIPIVE